VGRILRSGIFRNASTPQQLLTFLSAKSIAGAGESVKGGQSESRRSGARTISIRKSIPVQVLSRRLRARLKEYYSHAGSHNPILIHIPKGHYLPTLEPLIAESILAATVVDGTGAGGITIALMIGIGLEFLGLANVRPILFRTKRDVSRPPIRAEDRCPAPCRRALEPDFLQPLARLSSISD
jgi:hypothetical protein